MIFPDAKVTKGELADYYRALGAPMMAWTAQPADQPGPLPAGPRRRNASSRSTTAARFGPHVHHVPIREKDGSNEDYLYVEDAAGMLACVQMGTIEFHGWGSQVADVEKPDRIVFDLDPDVGLDFDAVKKAAQDIKRHLADMGLTTFPMLTGGKGVHVVVPLTPEGEMARGQGFRPALRAGAGRGRARALHRRACPRPSGPGGSSSTICATSAARPRSCPIPPAPAKARRSRRRSTGRSWTRWNRARRFTVRDADLLLERAASRAAPGLGRGGAGAAGTSRRTPAAAVVHICGGAPYLRRKAWLSATWSE